MAMIYGIGTDIVAYKRIEEMHARFGDKFARRILSDDELAEYANHLQQARFLMKRFAAKEAFAKAIGTGLRHPVSMREITITHDKLGKPGFVLSIQLSDYIESFGLAKMHLSISDEHDHAVAFVVIESNH